MATTGFGSLNPARVTPAKAGIHGRFRVADGASRLRRPLSRTAPPRRADPFAKLTLSSFAALRTVRSGGANGLRAGSWVGLGRVEPRPYGPGAVGQEPRQRQPHRGRESPQVAD